MELTKGNKAARSFYGPKFETVPLIGRPLERPVNMCH